MEANIWIMVGLVLLLIGKVYTVDDKEITSLMKTDWNLTKFVCQLIKTFMFHNGRRFGGWQNNHTKEIQVHAYSLQFQNVKIEFKKVWVTIKAMN